MADYKPNPYKGHPGWYEIPGYSKYAANRKGEVLNKKLGNATQGGVSGRYRKVDVYPDNSKESKLCYTHDLICRAFHGRPKKGQVVIHKDNDRLNIASGNLKWGTQAENVKSAWDDGLRKSKVSSESLQDMKKVDKKHIVAAKEVGELYHLSFAGTKAGVWSPMTPAGTELVEEQDEEFGEPPIPRISFSPTLEQCFRAIYPNIDFYFKDKKYPHLDIYAYRPRFTGRERLVLPETLTTERWVWDAHVTKEHWLLDKVRMELVGRYRFYNTEDGTRGFATRPFNDPMEDLSSYVGPTVVEFIPLNKSPSLESRPPSANW